MRWENAPDVKEIVVKLVIGLDLSHIQTDRVFCVRSYRSRSSAIARIWELPRVWQQVLSIPPAYVIEVVSERFDKLDKEEKEKTILHELLHIPKTFSGALVPHKCFGKRRVGERQVNKLYNEYKRYLSSL
ncbi:MAG: metallopeptidase [Candidatus Diapherotrites archaeon]|nr:metallopeptidase [Candidatus Diapherotrites archaeon]